MGHGEIPAPVRSQIRPRDAAQFALRIAEETDALVAELPLERLWPRDPESPINAGRGEHRGWHLDEIRCPASPGLTPGSLTDQGGVGNDEPRDAANPVRALGGRVGVRSNSKG